MLLLLSAEAPELDPEATKEHQYEAIPGPGPDTSQGDALTFTLGLLCTVTINYH